ncbi:MAG TPA: hypothetical protein VHV30_01405 [Polyangiaceae bacterium]|nr:hypothetical protein [Polyangiaceae bacterium]
MLLRRSHVMRDVGIAVALLGLLIGFVGRGDARLLCLIGLATAGSMLALLGLEGSVRRVAASLEAHGVRVGDKFMALGESIRSGWIERGPEGSTVYLDRGFRAPMRLEAKDDTQARALLRALSRDPSQSVVRFPSASRTAALAGAISGQLFAHGFMGHLEPRSLWFVVWSFLAVGPFLLWQYEMSIGADGVLMSAPLRSKFIPFADIESAVICDLGKVVMHTRSHGTVTHRLRPAAAEAAVELIQSSMASIGPGSEPVRQQLRREGPSVQAWIARLRSLAGRGSYRAIGLVGDSLWQVMDDPGASGAERAAAAVVVGSVATPEDRVRLREAAARIASPQVRVAIERAAVPAEDSSDSEGELVVALAAIEDAAGEGAL